MAGPASDAAYANTRDDPRGADAKRFVETLWCRFADLAETNFRLEAQQHFLERFWEMYLAVALRHRGFNVHRHGNVGPDFLIHDRKTRVWLEATAPGPGTGEDQVPQLVFGQFVGVPTERILLRYTNALAAKKKQYISALERGLLTVEDSYVLAFNSRGIRQVGDIGSTPYFLQAFLAIGQPFVDFDAKTARAVKSGYLHRPSIVKATESSVPMSGFLDKSMEFCSALLHSTVDCANHPRRLGSDFCVLHNPNARRPLSLGVFSWCEQFMVDGDRVRSLRAARRTR